MEFRSPILYVMFKFVIQIHATNLEQTSKPGTIIIIRKEFPFSARRHWKHGFVRLLRRQTDIPSNAILDRVIHISRGTQPGRKFLVSAVMVSFIIIINIQSEEASVSYGNVWASDRKCRYRKLRFIKKCR